MSIAGDNVQQATSRRFATVLCADVAGDGPGTEKEPGRVRAFVQSVADPVVSEHRGRIVKTVGDGFLALFENPVEAIRCAVVMNQNMAKRDAGSAIGQDIRFRIGMDFGDVIFAGDDVSGDGVDIATQLQSVAKPGEVYISSALYKRVKNKTVSGFDSVDYGAVGKVAGSVRAYRVLLGAAAVATARSRKRVKLAYAAVAALILIGGGVAGRDVWKNARSMPDEKIAAAPPVSRQVKTSEAKGPATTPSLVPAPTPPPVVAAPSSSPPAAAAPVTPPAPPTERIAEAAPAPTPPAAVAPPLTPIAPSAPPPAVAAPSPPPTPSPALAQSPAPPPSDAAPTPSRAPPSTPVAPSGTPPIVAQPSPPTPAAPVSPPASAPPAQTAQNSPSAPQGSPSSSLSALGQSLRDCADCPELTIVASGEFEMGATDTQYATPPRAVKIARAFAIGRREVSFDEWDRCFATGGCRHRPDDRGWGRGGRPVIDVSWNDAKAYTEWLSRKTGQKYRLPSEAEWEYAARAGTSTAFWWGRDAANAQANCTDCGGQAPQRKSTPTGSFQPNAFGLYDTSGNAAEWVEDCWNDNYRGAPRDGSAWTNGQCEQRVLRGGSFTSNAASVRSAFRFRYDSDVRYYANGFRIVRELD